MAEIRYPGVYVVETEASVTPIPGVDTVMDDETFAALVRDLHRTVHRYAPAWTDFNVHDPGVTLLQLLAWLAEAEGYRAHRLPASALGDAVRFATKAMALLDCASAVVRRGCASELLCRSTVDRRRSPTGGGNHARAATAA